MFSDILKSLSII